MSNTITFEFRSDVRPEVVCDNLKKLWEGGEFVEVFLAQEIFPGKPSDLLMCQLAYFYGSESQICCTRRILNYLFDIISDNYIYYYRCFDTIGCCKIYPKTLFPEDIFLVKFWPSMYDGIQYQYRIQRPT